jgi:Flp pilus assembly protein TadG
MASQSHQGDRWGLHTLLRRTRANTARGQALVEFAFTVVLLLMLLIGIIASGILLNNWVILTDAVRSGARELAISRAPGIDACTQAANRVQAAAIGLTAASIVVTSTVVDSCTSLTAGSDATVNATYPCDLSILGIDYAPGCTLRATSTVRVE